MKTGTNLPLLGLLACLTFQLWAGDPPLPPFPGDNGGGSQTNSDPDPPCEGDDCSGGGSDPFIYPPAFAYTNGLWLEPRALDTNATWLTMTVHGTEVGATYDLLVKTNLNNAGLTNWLVEQTLTGTNTNTVTGTIYFSGRTNLFFWARCTSCDSDEDGIPDYIEDWNNNGVFDAGDLSNFLDGMDAGFTISITEPKPGATFP